jgi:Holliday junction resolvase RusA-like endonuclease
VSIFFVIPGTPVGKGRPKFARRGAFVQAYTPEKTASYENLVKLAAADAMKGAAPVEAHVTVQMEIFITPPSSWSARKRADALSGKIQPTTKPDIDNVVKGVFDAMNDIVWKDDKQVTDLCVRKRYADVARTEVKVFEFGGSPL